MPSRPKCSLLSPSRTAVPFGGQITYNLTGLSPKRDCGSKRVKGVGRAKRFTLKPTTVLVCSGLVSVKACHGKVALRQGVKVLSPINMMLNKNASTHHSGRNYNFFFHSDIRAKRVLCARPASARHRVWKSDNALGVNIRAVWSSCPHIHTYMVLVPPSSEVVKMNLRLGMSCRTPVYYGSK